MAQNVYQLIFVWVGGTFLLVDLSCFSRETEGKMITSLVSGLAFILGLGMVGAGINTRSVGARTILCMLGLLGALIGGPIFILSFQ